MITKEKEKVSISTLKGEQAKFSIENSGKAFRTLIDTLYEHKVRAVVREIMSNAYDAHIEAGIPERPFDVRLPSKLNSHFFVRDYGNSMDHSTVMDLYSTIFKSTKESTNSQVGMFGLGSKSPFAYTDNFHVTTYRGGEQRDYLCFLDPEGVPLINHIDTIETEEPDGTKVTLAISWDDFDKFNEAFQMCSLPYEIQPNILGVNLQKLEPIAIVGPCKIYDGTKFEYWKPSDDLYLSQGSVLYSLTNDNLKSKFMSLFNINHIQKKSTFNYATRTYNNIVHNIVVLECPIGTFNVTPSREGISYDDTTRTSLEEYTKTVKEILQEYCHSTYKECKNRSDTVFSFSERFKYFNQDVYLKSWSTVFGQTMDSSIVRFYTDWHLGIHWAIQNANKDTKKIIFAEVEDKKYHPNLNSNINYKQVFEGRKNIVPGYLYSIASRKSDWTRHHALTGTEAKNAKYVVGAERKILRKFDRFQTYGSDAYLMFTEDLPRFARLLRIKPEQLISIESLPDTGSNVSVSTVTAMSNATVSVGANIIPITVTKELKTNQYYVRKMRNNVSDSKFSSYMSISYFSNRAKEFIRIYDQMSGTKLMDEFSKIELIFATPSDIVKKGWKEENHFGHWLDTNIKIPTFESSDLDIAKIINSKTLDQTLITHFSKKRFGGLPHRMLTAIDYRSALTTMAIGIIKSNVGDTSKIIDERTKFIESYSKIKKPFNSDNFYIPWSNALRGIHNANLNDKELEKIQEWINELEKHDLFKVNSGEEFNKIISKGLNICITI